MVQNNKILTVSYGTFSCTLEGFDDAFGTMKAIAEYFRDLAAEDRYFGAEPPQPDTDMLAHIAQKEIARRVEAHHDQSGIVLRAADAVTPAAAIAATPERRVSDPKNDGSPEAVEPTETGAPVPVAEDAPAPAEDTISDAVAGLVAQTEATAPTDAPMVAEHAPLKEPAGGPTADLADPIAQVDAGLPGDTEDPDGADTTDDAAAFFADSPAPEASDAALFEDVYEEGEENPEPPASEPTTPGAPANDSIAAKLQRIRAVVSKAAPTEEAAFTEDEHAEALSDDTAVSNGLSALDAVLAQESESSTDEAADMPEPEVDDTPVIARRIARVTQPAPVEAATQDDAAPAETADPVAALLADVGAPQGDVSPAAPEGPLAQEAEGSAPPKAQARVVKVSREEFDAIIAADRKEAEGAAPETSLSQEDEDDLLRELEEVAAEMRATPDAVDDFADVSADEVSDGTDGADSDELDEIAKALKAMEAEAAASAAAQTEDDAEELEDETADAVDDEGEFDSLFADTIVFAETGTLDETEEDEDDFKEERAILSADVDSDTVTGRIIDEAGDKLNDPDTSDRRSEFAHLRAALAAGKAEEAAGGSVKESASDDPYREDLARAVRPRRPETDETRERSRRPQDEKPAPLKLVAAQRVDAPADPVQPRRVMSTPQGEDDSGRVKFAEYAQSVGAVELPELLEAAAAYLSFVEGQQQFSRPQLMTKVRMVEQDEFSREDGLRSFGVLLRDGKIEKTQAGRFTVSDRIGFKPEDTREAS